MSTQQSTLNVLLVEDSPSDAHILRMELDELEGEPIVLRHVDRLGAALAEFEKSRFDVVLLDLGLPDSQGIETLTTLRGQVEEVAIVVLTGLNDEAIGLEAIRKGAQDYLVKGQIHGELLFRCVRYAAERNRLELTIRRTEEEFRIARRIQTSLFPDAAPQAPGLDIAGRSLPAEATGGDYFDYFSLAGGQQAIVVSDVCGHGYGPAILMAEVRAYLRAFAETTDDIAEILTKTNRLLTRDSPDERFAALFCASIAPDCRSLAFAGAGDRAFLFHADGSLDRLRATGLPLGIDPDAEVGRESVDSLSAGDVLLLLTDGLIETLGEDGIFGEKRICDVVVQNRHASADAIIDALFQASAEHGRGEAQRDDYTAAVVKILDVGGGVG
ncbi:MAG: fused response regulator/phosphatase [Planctomycetales bacterium]|nr:fused response regulator/phosphatase [Planctomycetales bacterium]